MAKTFIVPIGRSPSVALLPARPLTTSFTVPSPPAATIRSNPSCTARRASPSASPDREVECTRRALGERFDAFASAAGTLAVRGRIKNNQSAGHGDLQSLFFELEMGNVLHVQRFTRIILIVLGGLSLVAVVLLLGMNLYVQSQGTQARIREELSRRLGMPLQIQRTSVTPWGGLKLSGITIPQSPATAESSTNFLEAKSFGLRVGIFSLFSRRLVITNVSLIEPRVIWSQDQRGKWKLPSFEKEELEETARPRATAEESPPPGRAEDIACFQAAPRDRLFSACPSREIRVCAGCSTSEGGRRRFSVSGRSGHLVACIRKRWISLQCS